MPRSGSTLLQNILAQNEDFYVTPTSGLLELIYGARANYSTSPEFKAQDSVVMRQAFLHFCKAGLHAWFDAITDKPFVIDKSRGWGIHFDFLEAVLGEKPKIICMVRDLRQILSSMELIHRRHPERHKGVENHSNLTGTTTLKRAMMNLNSPPVGLALDRIREIGQRGWARDILFLRYEDLTSEPAATLAAIYAYLEVEPKIDHDFSRVHQVTQEDDQVYGILGLHQIRPVVKQQVHEFEEVLGPEVLQVISQQFGWYQRFCGYA